MIQFKNILIKKKKYTTVYKYLFKPKSWIRLSILFSILNSLIMIPFPIITKIIIDDIILQKKSDLILPCILAVLLIIPFMIAIPWLKQFYLFKLTHKTGIMLRKALCKHFLHLDLSCFMRHGPGYFSARIFDDVDSLVRSIYQVLFPILQNVLLFFTGLILMLYINWKLALIPCFFFPVYGYLNYHLGIKLKKESSILAEKKAKFFEFFTDMFQIIENIRYHVLEKTHLKSFFKKDSDILRQNIRVFYNRVSLDSLNSLMMILTPALVLIFGIFMIINNTMTLGEYVAFTSFMTYMLGPVKFFFSSNITFQDFRVAFERVSDAFEWPLSHEYLLDARNSNKQTVKTGEILLDSIFFSYADETNKNRSGKKIVLKNINLSIKQGERIVLMGKSGSGKTTLLKLIMGLYMPDKGTISIGGRMYNEINVIHLRKQIAFVEQEPILFKGSVEYNILLNSPIKLNIKEAVEEATRSSSAHDFIKEMEKGYKTDISRLGNNLSVGQKQRIALSRFFHKGANLLILDEPTSAIDTTSAVSIRDALRNVSSKKTIIVVTHNPLIAKFADRVIILDSGEIIRDGELNTIINEPNFMLNQ